MMKETANKNPMFNVCLYRCRRAATFPNEEKPNKKNLSPALRQNVSFMHPGYRKMKRKCIDE